MKKKISPFSFLLLILFLMVSTLGTALEVDTEELEQGRDGPVEFINYEGPYDKIDTREQIFGIGRSLGSQVPDKANKYTFNGKYTVIHAVDLSVNEKLDADIFIVEKDASVDHIRNLRLMIQGYLETAYEYTAEDAALLAEFITVYNAVFRGNSSYIESKYKEIVIKFLVPEKIGLSTVYSEWPGKSMILIPLTEKAGKGTVGSLGTDELTEEDVIENLRTREDMGLEERRDMVDLKEREIEESVEQIQEEQQELDQREEELQERLERIPADLTEEEAQEVEQELVSIEERREELAQEEEEQDERIERIQEEREEIAEDTRTMLESEGEVAAGITEIIQEEGEAVSAPDIITVLLVKEISGEVLCSLASVNKKTGEIVKESSLNTIRQRWFGETSDVLFVLAGREEGQGAVRLLSLDRDTYEIISQSEDDIFKNSELLLYESYVYAVFNEGGEWKIGKYNPQCSRIASSTAEVDPITDLLIQNSALYVQDKRGKIIVLDIDNLTAE